MKTTNGMSWSSKLTLASLLLDSVLVPNFWKNTELATHILDFYAILVLLGSSLESSFDLLQDPQHSNQGCNSGADPRKFP